MKFTKMQGLGNDYIYINSFEEEVKEPSKLAVGISDRHFGVGSDGLILIGPSKIADAKMEMYNADGSQSEMCGNGIRCVAKYLYDYGIVKKKVLEIETLAGVKTLELHIKEDIVTEVTVNMGEPKLDPAEIPAHFEGEKIIDRPLLVGDENYHVTCVSMGNPHVVVFVEEIDGLNLEKIGPLFEHHVKFPKRINVEFVQIVDREHIKMRVWERGSGETLACGTGASASAVASILNGKTEWKIDVELAGGHLSIEWRKDDRCIYMTGPAEVVFDGEIKDEKEFYRL